MKLNTYILMCTCFVAFSAGCATTPYDPFVKSRSDILDTLSVVSIVPIELEEFDRMDEVAARYEYLITKRLEAAGITVIPCAEYASIWDPMVEQMGGMYDAVTGELDKGKLESIRLHTSNELVGQFNIDALVRPAIVVTKADWYGNKATWDGVKDETTGKKGFWASLAASDYSGSIPALSLILPITGTDGEIYYVGRGGIQLFARFSLGRFEDVPESMWFAEPERDEKAVNVALRPLLKDPLTQ
jgi:hypothetical protein